MQLQIPDLPEPVRVVKHPAKYSNGLMPVFLKMLSGVKIVLDPFAGTGKITYLKHFMPETNFVAVELEPEWATMTVGNALRLPFADNTFDAVCTSPTYGNRMADGLRQSVLDGKWTTHCYADKLGRRLSSDNSGAMQWGDTYRQFHIEAWLETSRVLRTDSMLILNIKDHIRDGKVQPVTEWHIGTIKDVGFELVEHIEVDTPSMRYGRNSEKRVGCESVIKFIKL